MKIYKPTTLKAFAENHPASREPLKIWHETMLAGSFSSFMELKTVFGNKVDVVGKGFVFNIGANKYRLAASIHFNTQRIFIREIMTHAEYSKDAWKQRHQAFR